MLFLVENICPHKGLTCDYCELEESQRFADMLVQSLASTSLLLYGENKTPSESDINALKSKLMEALQLKSIVPLGLPAVEFTLEKFGAPERSTLSKVSSLIAQSSPLEHLRERMEELSRTAFMPDERLLVAKLIIRKHDSEYRFHCPISKCGEECEFAIVSCPNKGT